MTCSRAIGPISKKKKQVLRPFGAQDDMLVPFARQREREEKKEPAK
jgi:hypothetical protein